MPTAPGLNERMDYLSPPLSLSDFGIYLSLGEGAARQYEQTRRLLTNRPCSSFVREESYSKGRLRVSNWIVQRLNNDAVDETVEL
jgi:hypothetical protein